MTGLKLGGLWYDAERHGGADIQNAFNKDAVFVYAADAEVEKAIDDSMAARTDAEAAVWGKKISKMIRDKYMRPPLVVPAREFRDQQKNCQMGAAIRFLSGDAL